MFLEPKNPSEELRKALIEKAKLPGASTGEIIRAIRYILGTPEGQSVIDHAEEIMGQINKTP